MATNTVQTEVEKFLGQGPVPLYIGGSWRAAHGGDIIAVHDLLRSELWRFGQVTK